MMLSQQVAKGLDPQQVRSTRAVRRAQHELAHIYEIIKFKLDEDKKFRAGDILRRQVGPHQIKKEKDGGTGKHYQHIERYEPFRTDQPDDSNVIDSCRLVIYQSDLVFEGYEMEIEGHEGVFWLNYAEPTESFDDGDRSLEAKENNLMPVLPVKVDMHTPASDRDDKTLPVPNIHFVRLVQKKLVHLLATTDILNQAHTINDILNKAVVALNRFFLTDCRLYLPHKKDVGRWEKLIKQGRGVSLLVIAPCDFICSHCIHSIVVFRLEDIV